MSKRWKGIEAEVAKLLGGRRVPLSGMHSGHNTSADVMNDPESEIEYPDFLYVECKRDKQYEAMLLPLHLSLQQGALIITIIEDVVYYIFRLDIFLKIKIAQWDGYTVCNNRLGKYKRVWNLLFDTQRKSIKEDKDAYMCVFKLHNKRGYIAITDSRCFEMINEWRVKHLLKKR